MSTIQLNESDIRYMVTECVKRILSEDIEEGKFGKFMGTAALGAALAMGTPSPANAQLNITNQEPKQVLVQEENKVISSFAFGELIKDNDGYKFNLETMLYPYLIYPEFFHDDESIVSKQFIEYKNKYINSDVPYMRHALSLGTNETDACWKEFNSEVNDFFNDKRDVVSIFLGVDESSVLKSLNQLEQFIKDNDKTTIQQDNGNITLVSGKDLWNKDGMLYVFQDGIIGGGIIGYIDIRGGATQLMLKKTRDDINRRLSQIRNN